MEKIDLSAYLSGNEYPGRGICIGVTPDGKQALIGYFIYKFTEIKTTEDVYLMATRYSHELGYAILGIAALVVCYLIYKGRKSKKA